MQKQLNGNEREGRYIYRRYITRHGVKLYPKNGKVFRFWVAD